MSIKVIAKFAQENGNPSLLNTIKLMGDQYEELDLSQQDAYDAVYEELMEFAKQQNG